MAITLGAGATAVFADSGFTASYVRHKLPTSTREAADATAIDTNTQMHKAPAAKMDPGVAELEFYYDPAAGTKPPIVGDAELLTYDYDGAGAGTDTMTGTGFVTSVDYGEVIAAGNVFVKGTMQFTFDGGYSGGTALTFS